jgi:hypothetical protein
VEVSRHSRLTSAIAALLLFAAAPAVSVGAGAVGGMTARDGAAAFAAPQACNGRCLNPHPNQFKTWYGQRKGTWVQVYRQWSDGCTQYQWFDTQSNRWDEDARTKAPKIFWTCCVH